MKLIRIFIETLMEYDIWGAKSSKQARKGSPWSLPFLIQFSYLSFFAFFFRVSSPHHISMNPYHRGHSWNPYNCNLLPNRVATLSDVRYRSFQQAPQITSRSAKSRASLALPNYNSSKVQEWLWLWNLLVEVSKYLRAWTSWDLLLVRKN